MFQHYRFSIVFTLVCLALGSWYGWVSSGSIAGTAQVLWIIVVLSVLEVSLSFDNAVVNATVLKGMDEIWQRRFLTWGMVIAVYGMYVMFPLAIVAVAAIMLLSARYEIPESVTGLIGAVLIGFSLWWSIRANRREHAIG